jgi:uncharacterized Tic20 family protein
MASDQVSSQRAPEPRTLPLASDEPVESIVLTSNDRILAMMFHVGGLLASVIVPLALYLTLQRSSRFLVHHCREALNFQLSQMIYALVLTLLILVIVAVVGVTAGWEMALVMGATGWLLLGAAFALVEVVLVVMACVAAWRGQWFCYPLCLHLVP